MSRQIFVNRRILNLFRAMAIFSKQALVIDPQLTDDHADGMVIGTSLRDDIEPRKIQDFHAYSRLRYGKRRGSGLSVL